MMARIRAARERTHRHDEEGLTIVELVVAMGIFTIVLIVYLSAMVSMSKTTVEAQNISDAANELRASFTRMDRQVRYASSINVPGQGASGAWYVEFELTELPQTEDPLCYQWRYDTTDLTVSYRSWREDGVSTVTDWTTVAWSVTATGGGSPFTLTPASATANRQVLDVAFTAVNKQGESVSDQATTFVARNSSISSTSNSLASDGQSATPVCMTGMDRQ